MATGVHRDEIRVALTNDGSVPGLTLPGVTSIAPPDAGIVGSG
ncbi:hypothetical protein [Kutzneria buriramensis]|uniref:Uncharacterized protein n=1 Tax=Kutzneria buriramensis TaxID=1045776 RepID=A0A3E0HI21_9PSEU|nr:hypothetical protein [Kutzneria buriramensis]REH46134.1 hypothetical protein BCF44_107267 [Kutzneria buriramensis]